ncbi:MAG: metallophosphoesterase [Thermoplasmata archaeon]
MIEPEPLWNTRILSVDNTLVIADLHIGYERELEEKGIQVTSKTSKMVKSVAAHLKSEEVTRLIINGDVKHNIPSGSWQEYEEIPRAMDRWLSHVDEIHVFPGNHDGGIESYLPSEVIIHESRGDIIDGIGYFHGHANPSDNVLDAEIIITAHTHPAVTLLDSLGNREKYICWIKFDYIYNDSMGKGIIMPPLNPLLGGVSFNEDGYLGPFLNNIDKENVSIHLLDGTQLGKSNQNFEHYID